MKLEWGLTAGNAEGEVDRLLAVSRKAEGGLPLTEAQARAVAQAHGEALRRTGRIEFGKSAAEKLAEVFAGSPWLTREEKGQQLAELAAQGAGQHRVQAQRVAVAPAQVFAQPHALALAERAELVIVVGAKTGLAVAHEVERSHGGDCGARTRSGALRR